MFLTTSGGKWLLLLLASAGILRGAEAKPMSKSVLISEVIDGNMTLEYNISMITDDSEIKVENDGGVGETEEVVNITKMEEAMEEIALRPLEDNISKIIDDLETGDENSGVGETEETDTVMPTEDAMEEKVVSDDDDYNGMDDIDRKEMDPMYGAGDIGFPKNSPPRYILEEEIVVEEIGERTDGAQDIMMEYSADEETNYNGVKTEPQYFVIPIYVESHSTHVDCGGKNQHGQETNHGK